MTILASARAIPDHRIRGVTPAPRDSTIELAFIPTGGDLSHPDEISSTVGDASVFDARTDSPGAVPVREASLAARPHYRLHFSSFRNAVS
jgi:hypothetical protein